MRGTRHLFAILTAWAIALANVLPAASLQGAAVDTDMFHYAGRTRREINPASHSSAAWP